jgi:putative transposase
MPDEANHRQTTRLENFDYSSPGAYFVTICATERLWLFGDVIEDEMKLNDAGEMVQEDIQQLPTRFDCLEIDEFVVMPNHLHVILVLREEESDLGDEGRANRSVRPYRQGGDLTESTRRGELNVRLRAETIPRDRGEYQHPTGTKDGSLGRIVQRLKTFTTQRYIRGVHDLSWPPFEKRLWQRNYFERVIRDEQGLLNARNYILENPLKWHLDVMNSAKSLKEVD